MSLHLRREERGHGHDRTIRADQHDGAGRRSSGAGAGPEKGRLQEIISGTDECDAPRKALKLPLNDSESRAQSTVAVVAEHYWQARQALEAMPIEWDDGEGARWKTNEQLNAAVLARLDTPGDKVERETGDALGVLGKSRRVVEATYRTPFADQAPLEPLNATARVTDGKIEVWHNGAIQAQS